MADAPGLAVDIAPARSLVARVMEGVGARNLNVQPGASPHECSLRPSKAATLQGADVVPWTVEDLTSWMVDAVKDLAGNDPVTTLLEAERAAESARQCQGIPGGWTCVADRLRPLITRTLSRMARMESEVSA